MDGRRGIWGLAVPAVMIGSVAWGQQSENTGEAVQSSVLESLVVTAELIDRPVQSSSQSVAIMDQAALEKQAGLSTLRDALESVANLSVVTGTGKAPTVRGVDGTGPAENAIAFFAGSRPRLSWQIDNRPASYNEVVFGDLGLFDVERIEVLRGPQSTLVGRNAIAGTVVVKTRDPAFDTAGRLRVAAGNDSQRQVGGVINVPLVNDRVALRVSGDWHEKNSAVDYDPYPGVSDPGQIEGVSARAKLLVVPDTTRDSRLLVTLAHTAYSGPNGEIVVRPFEKRRSNYPQQPRHKPETNSLAVDYSQSLSPDWQMQVTLSATDFDFTRSAVPETSNATISTREYVLEPQLRYSHAGTSAVVGLHYYRARQDEFIEILGGQNFDDRIDTLAGYVEGITPLTDTIDLSLGLRFEQEERNRKGGDDSGVLVRIASDERYQSWLPKVGLTWHASDEISWGVQVSKGYNSGGAGVTFASPVVNYEFDEETAWTYEVYGRQEFVNGRIRTTQNLFYSRYRDMQLPFDLTPEDSRDEAFVVRNANSVETRGLELGISANLARSLDIWGSLGWLDTEVSDFPSSGIEGNELLMAPELTARLGLSLQYANWQASLAARYSDRYFSDVNNRPGGQTDAYMVADADVSYQVGRYRLFGTVKNLFDTDKPVARYPGVAPANSSAVDRDFDSAVLLQPRTMIAGVEMAF